MTLPSILVYDKPILKRGGNSLRPKQLNIEVTDELYKELSIYCISNNAKKKELITKLIKDFLKKQGEK